MVAAELAPLAKVGGLADVVGSLPPALKKLKCDIRVVMPFYGNIEKTKYKIKKIKSNIPVMSAKKIIKINLYETIIDKVKIYLIDCPQYFSFKQVYSVGNDAERFLFFALSALHITPVIKFKPAVIHCHDSHTALIPDLLKVAKQNLELKNTSNPEMNKIAKYLENTKTLFTIHNLNYQGKTKIKTLTTGNLTKNSLESLSKDAQDGDINFMVQGILNADLINTVSETYAKEITTKEYGAKLENIIKKRKTDLYGIINGINIDAFDPAKDKLIAQKFSLDNIDKKVENKLALQKQFNLEENKDMLLVGFISRLAWQKGIELITEMISKKLIDITKCQFVFLGTGQEKYEKELVQLEKKFPNQVRAKIMFDIKLAQQIYAGSDIFLMPSRFEPCGLGQMFAMRYGTIPIARATGGLSDTVFDTGKNVKKPSDLAKNSTGFIFNKFETKELAKALNRAINTYYKYPLVWKKIVKNCMQQDFSWNRSAKKYLELYKKLSK